MGARQQFLSCQDICEILHVSKTTGLRIMHIMEHRGKLIRVGKMLRVKMEDFEQWVNEQEG